MRVMQMVYGLAFAAAVLPAAATDAEVAAIKAALPTEIKGWKAADQDIVDVSGTPEAITFVRFYNTETGQLQVQVRLWEPSATDAEAASMLDPGTESAGGTLVEVGGHKGLIFSGVLNLYPGTPGEGLTVSVGPSQDNSVLTEAAAAVDIAALMAIR